jgi:hypothetical protein
MPALRAHDRLGMLAVLLTQGCPPLVAIRLLAFL